MDDGRLTGRSFALHSASVYRDPIRKRGFGSRSTKCSSWTRPLVSPRAADGCIAPMTRKPVRATPTSPVALLLPQGIGLLLRAEKPAAGPHRLGRAPARPLPSQRRRRAGYAVATKAFAAATDRLKPIDNALKSSDSTPGSIRTPTSPPASPHGLPIVKALQMEPFALQVWRSRKPRWADTS